MLEYWVSKAEKVLLLVQERFAEAGSKEFLAFNLKSAAGGRSSNLYQGNVARSDFSGGLGSFRAEGEFGQQTKRPWNEGTMGSIRDEETAENPYALT